MNKKLKNFWIHSFGFLYFDQFIILFIIFINIYQFIIIRDFNLYGNIFKLCKQHCGYYFVIHSCIPFCFLFVNSSYHSVIYSSIHPPSQPPIHESIHPSNSHRVIWVHWTGSYCFKACKWDTASYVILVEKIFFMTSRWCHTQVDVSCRCVL